MKYGASLLERMRPMYPIASPELQESALRIGQTMTRMAYSSRRGRGEVESKSEYGRAGMYGDRR